MRVNLVVVTHPGSSASSFLEMRDTAHVKLGGEEMSAKINLLKVSPPAIELESKLNDIENVRFSHEAKVFQQAPPYLNNLVDRHLL